MDMSSGQKLMSASGHLEREFFSTSQTRRLGMSSETCPQYRHPSPTKLKCELSIPGYRRHLPLHPCAVLGEDQGHFEYSC